MEFHIERRNKINAFEEKTEDAKQNKKMSKKNEERKRRLDEEDNKEFYMQGKPYKEKFNGKRLSKVIIEDKIYSLIMQLSILTLQRKLNLVFLECL